MTHILGGAVALLVLVCPLAHASDGDALACLRTRGTVRWGGDIQGGEPYVYQDPTDTSRAKRPNVLAIGASLDSFTSYGPCNAD